DGGPLRVPLGPEALVIQGCGDLFERGAILASSEDLPDDARLSTDRNQIARRDLVAQWRLVPDDSRTRPRLLGHPHLDALPELFEPIPKRQRHLIVKKSAGRTIV